MIVEPSNDVLDKFLDDDINFQGVDSLSNLLDGDSKKFKRYTPKEFVRESPITPAKLYAVLQKESPLYKIENDKIIKNSKKIYVKAREVYYGGKWSYIYNKNGEVKYKTETKNLAFIEEVINLRSKIAGNEIYPPKSRYNIIDSTIPFEFHIVYKSESSNFKGLNTITQNELESSKSSSIGIKGYFNSLLPIDFGLALDYQAGEAQNNNESVIWKSISIGPTIKYDFLKLENFSFNTQFAVKKSLVFNASSELSDAQFSSLAWQIGVEAVYHTNYGNLSLGFDNSFIKTSVKGELNEQTSFNNEKETSNQNAITLGYQYTWML